MPAGAVLFSPAVDLTLSGTSMRSKAEIDPIFTPADIKWFFDQYLSGSQRSATNVSPLFADLTGLPPLLIQVGSSELLLDDAVRLAGRAGVDEVAVTLEIASKQPHVFQHQESTVATAALKRAGQFLAAQLPSSSSADVKSHAIQIQADNPEPDTNGEHERLHVTL